MKITATSIGVVLSAALLTTGCENKEDPKPEAKPSAAPATSSAKPVESARTADEKKPEDVKSGDAKDAKKDGKEHKCAPGACG